MISGLIKLIENKNLRQSLRNNTPKSLNKFFIKDMGKNWKNFL